VNYSRERKRNIEIQLTIIKMMRKSRWLSRYFNARGVKRALCGDKIVGYVHHAGPISGFFAPSFPAVRLLWMNGKTPPPAIVARTSVSSSSSPRIASCKCRGVMRLTRRSFDALPLQRHEYKAQRYKTRTTRAHLRAPRPRL
jgi:hypothetical protein